MCRRVMSTSIEALEGRTFLSVATPSQAVVQTAAPPRVEHVWVGGAAWAPQFRQYVQARHPTSVAEYGFSVYDPDFTPVLPWVNLDQITVRLSYSDMTVEPRHLRVRGVTVASYGVVAVQSRNVDSDTIATFTLAQPLRRDRLLIEVDGSEDGVHIGNLRLDGDRDGVPGGDFRLRLDVLPGNVNGGAWVAPTESVALRYALGTSVSNPRDRYTIFEDVDGSGRIDLRDIVEVRRRENTRLPFTEPAAAGSLVTPSRARPATRGLFGSVSILA